MMKKVAMEVVRRFMLSIEKNNTAMASKTAVTQTPTAGKGGYSAAVEQTPKAGKGGYSAAVEQ